MITRDYIIKNAELTSVVIDEPVAFAPGLTPKYSAKIILSDEDARSINLLVEEVSEASFGTEAKGVLGVSSGRSRVYSEGDTRYMIYANSSVKPKIAGMPISKGTRLSFIRSADVHIQVYSQATLMFKGVGIELKELIFNHQPQPTGEQDEHKRIG